MVALLNVLIPHTPMPILDVLPQRRSQPCGGDSRTVGICCNVNRQQQSALAATRIQQKMSPAGGMHMSEL
jgi:hypothetical protein